MKCKIIAAIAMLTAASCGYAAEQEVPMNLVSADGKEVSIGKITIQETPTVCCSHQPFTLCLKAFMVFMCTKKEIAPRH